MDSLSLFRTVIWDLNDRDQADVRLERILAWVGENALPERVFDQAKLDAWAHQQGFTQAVDVKAIAALLRQVERYIPVHDPVGVAVRDMIHAYG
jgi:hypothetical protein